jgi:hypothetical protein
MRTARSRTSGENLFDFFMTQSSQRFEPPQIPGRFKPKFAPEGYYFTVKNAKVLQYKNKIGIVTVEDEGTGLHLPPQLYIDQFFLSGGAPELLGTISFGLCAITAHLYGLSFIELVAGGGGWISLQADWLQFLAKVRV